MKNRNIPYYMAVLALAAGMSTSFVSCVDTEEPDSIVTLRNAKAEEVKAQAAKINAEVTDLLGRLELDKSTRALADEATKLANARKEAQNAYDKAKEDIQLAEKKAESERKENAAKATADFELQTAKAKAEADLKDALAKLEAAKASLTIAENNAIKDVEAEQLAIDKKKMAVAIETAQFKEWGLSHTDANGKVTYDLKDSKDAYLTALDDLSDALKALKKSIAKLEEDNIETITDKIEACEEEIANAQEGKAEFDALCKANDIQKWIDKYAELDKKISENDQNPDLTQLKYDKEGLDFDMKTLNKKIQTLKRTRDGYHPTTLPEGEEEIDGLVEQLNEAKVKEAEAQQALNDFNEDYVSVSVNKGINKELAGVLQKSGVLSQYVKEKTVDGDIERTFELDLKFDGEEPLLNEDIDEDKLQEILAAITNGSFDNKVLTDGFEKLTKVAGALYQNIREVEEGIKQLASHEAEDKLVERVSPAKGKGNLTKWEETATDYLSHPDNEKSYEAFVKANNDLFGTFVRYDEEEKENIYNFDANGYGYYSYDEYSNKIFNPVFLGSYNKQPLSVLPAKWDEEHKVIDVTNLVEYGYSKDKALEIAKKAFGEYSEYLKIMEKNAEEAEFKEAKTQAEAIIDAMKGAFKDVLTQSEELNKALEDAIAEDEKANAELIKQINDIDAQVLEKGDEKTLAKDEDDVAAEDGTLIKEKKELQAKIDAKQAAIAEYNVDKEKALRSAILGFGLKLDLFTLNADGSIKVDDKNEIVINKGSAYNNENRAKFEEAYQATVDYYNNAIESTQEELEYYQGILKAFQDKISGANTAAADADVNKAIDFDFSSKALKEFFESDDIAKDYADLIKDVETKQGTVKEKESALEKAEADYNFYKKAYGVDKE